MFVHLDKAALLPTYRRIQNVHDVLFVRVDVSWLQLLHSHLAHQDLS